MSKKIILRDLLDFAPPLVACMVMLLIFGIISVIMFPVVVLASLGLLFYKRRINTNNLYKHELAESAKALRSIYNSIKKGANIVWSIEGAENAVAKGSHIKDVFLSIKQRIMLGQDLANAANAEIRKNARNSVAAEALGPLSREYENIGSVNESAAGTAISLEKHHAELKADEEGRLPRYLIIAMVTSTILPSMATFAFVGYSILYYSVILLMLYCTVMLGVLPSLYSAIRMKIFGLYNG